MRKSIILAALLMIVGAGLTPAQAARRYTSSNRQGSTYSYQQGRRSNPGFFARLMELERRKNAAIARALGIR